MTVYKYWVQVGEDEKFGLKGWFHGLSSNTEKLLDKEKHSPATIHLGYNGSEGYNTSAWVKAENPETSTAERDVYYYTGILPVGGETAPLFDTLWVDSSVAKSRLRLCGTGRGRRRPDTQCQSCDPQCLGSAERCHDLADEHPG